MGVRNDKLNGTDVTFGEADFASADYNDTNDELISWISFSFGQNGINLIRQLKNRSISFSSGSIEGWAEAYIDADGREDSVTGAIPIFDTDKYTYPTTTNDPIVVIEADDDTITWTNNNCILYKLQSGKWVLKCTTGDIEVKRAQIHKSLWYGTDGTDQLISDFTSITAVKTNVTRDIGKRASYVKTTCIETQNATRTATYTGTFDDTTDNTDCSSWSRIEIEAPSGNDAELTGTWELPEGTTLHTLTKETNEDETTDEMGTDLTADEDDNPADSQIYFSVRNNLVQACVLDVRMIMLHYDSITWAEVDANSIMTIDSSVDYFDDNSIPVLSALTEAIISHDIPAGTFIATIKTAIGVPMIEDWESGIDIKYKLINATEDTGWLDVGTTPEKSTFTAFTSEPTKLLVNLIAKVSAPTANYPSINGFYVIAK